jgi:S1-C subfamily serine protease
VPGSERGSLTASALFVSLCSAAALLLLALVPPDGEPQVRSVQEPRAASGYDKSPDGLNGRGASLEDALGAVRRLRTRVTYEIDGEPLTSELEGTGFIVDVDGVRCIVSLAHVVSEEPVVAAASPRGAAAWRLRGRRMSERTVIDLPAGEVEIAPLGKNVPADLAFFRLPAGVEAPALPFPAGDSDRLRIGDFVYLLGRLEGTDLHVRSGIVSALTPTARVAALPGARDVFMISAPLSPGDSGSPVLAVRSGRCELVGIAQGKYETAREAGWALRINPVLAALRSTLGAEPPVSSASR